MKRFPNEEDPIPFEDTIQLCARDIMLVLNFVVDLRLHYLMIEGDLLPCLYRILVKLFFNVLVYLIIMVLIVWQLAKEVLFVMLQISELDRIFPIFNAKKKKNKKYIYWCIYLVPHNIKIKTISLTKIS
jgi:hypothetical protein